MLKTSISMFLAVSVGLAVCGCGHADHATTADEKKSFDGGPMPPDALKRFQDSQKKSAELRAARAQQAQTNAQNGGK